PSSYALRARAPRPCGGACVAVDSFAAMSCPPREPEPCQRPLGALAEGRTLHRARSACERRDGLDVDGPERAEHGLRGGEQIAPDGRLFRRDGRVGCSRVLLPRLLPAALTLPPESAALPRGDPQRPRERSARR